jgi:hypothetical protein
MTRRSLAGGGAAMILVVAGALLISSKGATQTDPNEVRTVIVRSECDHSVWLFYGRTPPTRPQDAVQLGSRASAAQQMLEGDVVWLLDDTWTSLGSATLAATTTEVIVDASCRSITAIDGG